MVIWFNPATESRDRGEITGISNFITIKWLSETHSYTIKTINDWFDKDIVRLDEGSKVKRIMKKYETEENI